MSLTNLHYKKIAKAYLREFLPSKVSVRIVQKPVLWFLKKTGEQITFNIEALKKVKFIAEKETTNFIDCLLVCSLHYLKEIDEYDIEVTPVYVLETLKAPFYNKEVECFLKQYLSFTAKENYRNLEIVDDLEHILENKI